MRLLTDMKQHGYRLVLFFLWLPSSDLAVARVANRVRQGGHNVPEPTIRQRFRSGIRNLFALYRPLVDSWWLYDVSQLSPRMIAAEADGELQVVDTSLFNQITPSAEK